ncbi:hypothetical protein D1BOALGB6SA_8701 [Olavius sp. associated proteobacterium Delta 1]|nr:hypothetical protein D1BOALGB6SA_8701 [Olavius sp. associated proteobacterium Delta 1]
MKRILDITAALTGLLLLSPILLIVMVLIWRQDFHSPFYIAPRVGKTEKIFNMVKLRSMIVGADKSGVDSTSAMDPRITPIGNFVRKFKLDEFTQLWNVLKGDMSLVGPRPNVKRETDLYTDIEKKLLSARPGITDLASIVFSDENEILKDSRDPDLDYNQLIRPWKSRLGILYIDQRSLWLDIRLILLTAVAVINRGTALEGVNKILTAMNAPADIIRVSRRKDKLVPFPPPGSDAVVRLR